MLVVDGVIEKLAFHDLPDYALPSVPDGEIDEVFDVSGLLLFPGLIDCHVHFREPGLTHKATMQSEAAAARAGGVTTVCEMPNTIPPTVTIAALADKVRRAAKIEDCDLQFFFGITEVAHLHALRELWTGTSAELRRLKKHCCGMKLFLDHSTGNQKIAAELLDEVFAMCAELGIVIVAHCEDPEINEAAMRDGSRREADSAKRIADSDVAVHSQMRPPESEEKAVKMAVDLVRKHGAHLHVAHLSTKQGLALIAKAKKEKLPVTCEVSPHHLLLTVDDYAELGTFAKVNPPIRTKEHVEALWKGISDGVVDCIATDHAPHTKEEKAAKNPLQAPSGLPGVETMVPLLLSVAAGKMPGGSAKGQGPRAKLLYQDILRLCFENPNRIFGLGKKGITEGAPVDLIFVDPEAEWTIRASELHSLCGWTPFEGWEVKGKIVRWIG